ncbi:hypothetical protein O1611_g3479 [Lasiodiplodia mahajangana]|uniref:Uncharacterized protein n=1 Tax=Lasiodiplodia mahajangana TaxID=1108764 RepID=A0ACC2JSA8_9PEZI|nr:hypothetical protein O1611_g3479 [Lasiodiplodia mahajangana]
MYVLTYRKLGLGDLCLFQEQCRRLGQPEEVGNSIGGDGDDDSLANVASPLDAVKPAAPGGSAPVISQIPSRQGKRRGRTPEANCIYDRQLRVDVLDGCDYGGVKAKELIQKYLLVFEIERTHPGFHPTDSRADGSAIAMIDGSGSPSQAIGSYICSGVMLPPAPGCDSVRSYGRGLHREVKLTLGGWRGGISIPS